MTVAKSTKFRQFSACRCVNCITPPHMLKKLLESSDKAVRDAALATLLATARLRGARDVRMAFAAAPGSAQGRRTIFDCQSSTDLDTARLARSEDGAASSDDAVNRAFEGFGTTRQFYHDVFDRDSIDGRGMRLDGFVHRGVNYNNAFWDGARMVFGDGDGIVFTDFTKSLDVIAHELAHGVTEFTAGMVYLNQSGALNESMSDVFGSLVKQWSLHQTAAQADWLIGADVFTPGIDADALRSLKDPGSAYDNALFGKDPQPGHMNKFVHTSDDAGGVHINSGIPNKAFYLVATDIGGFAWEAPGHIWYEALKASTSTTEFQEFADTTHVKAGTLYGTGSAEQQAVVRAWREVGIRITGAPAVARGAMPASREADGLAALSKQIEGLSAKVSALTNEVAALKRKKP